MANSPIGRFHAGRKVRRYTQRDQDARSCLPVHLVGCSADAGRRRLRSHLCILLALFCLFISGCGNPFSGQPQATSTPTTASEPHWGVRAKTSGCAVRGPLQDPDCTPGDIFLDATREQVCTPGYASAVRNVSTSTKRRVYAEYGITQRLPGQYEVDHLVNLSIGGSNDISNLWPEAINPRPGAREKDRVESYLHDQVCAGAISLQQAQIEIATNWLNVYNRLPANEKTPATNGSGSP